jgi:hypothetical protein
VLTSYLLRLVPSAAADGRIVGELESVLTGQIRTVHDTDELIALVRSDQHQSTPSEPPEELS